MATINIDFSVEAKERIAQLAKKEGRTKSEIIRRALGVYEFLSDRVRQGQSFVAVATHNGDIIAKLEWE